MSGRTVLFAGILAVGGTLAVTIQPSSANFGKIAVGNTSSPENFTVSVIGGGRDSLTIALTGLGAGDFRLGRGQCAPVDKVCYVEVTFQPRSEGLKTASLDIVDKTHRMVSASLTGTGVAPVCTNNVVFCNYAFLYSGHFDWSTATETVKVTIVDGVATCNGSATFQGRPKGIVNGTGLVAVEFVRGTITDSTGNEGPERLVYRVTVACPSPAVPATPDVAAVPSRPAELGDFFQQSYNQPASGVGIDITGSISYPVEGEGAVQVTWSLKRK